MSGRNEVSVVAGGSRGVAGPRVSRDQRRHGPRLGGNRHRLSGALVEDVVVEVGSEGELVVRSDEFGHFRGNVHDDAFYVYLCVFDCITIYCVRVMCIMCCLDTEVH